MTRRLAILLAVAVSGPFSAPISTRGQVAPDESEPKSGESAKEVLEKGAITLTEALDRALADLRVAESKGPGANEAFARVHEYLGLVTSKEQTNVRAAFYRARLMVLVGRAGEAMRTIERWTKSFHGRNDWEGHLILGNIYLDSEYYKLARPQLEEALQLNQQSPQIHISLARCATKQRDYVAAVRHAQIAVQLLGNRVRSSHYLLWSDALLQIGQLDAAEAASIQARKLAGMANKASGGSMATLQEVDFTFAGQERVIKAKLQASQSSWSTYLELSSIIEQRATLASRMASHKALVVIRRGLQMSAAVGDQPPEELMLEEATLLGRIGDMKGASESAKRLLSLYPSSSGGRAIMDALSGEVSEAMPPQAGAQAP